MSDKDFDKIFGDKLREERSFSSQDKDWEELSARLDAANVSKENEKKRRLAAWLWLLTLPILSLLLWQIMDIKNQNKQLAAQLTDLQAQLAAHTSVRDTIVQQLQKKDTVWVYKQTPSVSFNKKTTKLGYANEKSVRTALDFAPAMQNVKALDLTNSEIIVSNQDTVSPKQSKEEKKIAELNEKLELLDKQITDLKQMLSEAKVNMPLLADCGLRQDSLKKQLVEAQMRIDSLKNQPLSTNLTKNDKTLTNNRLFIGFQGGKISYKTTWTNSLGIDLYKNIESYQVGLKIEYALTDKLRLTAEGDFCPFTFTNYWQSSRYNLPALQFDPQKEKFFRAESKQSLLQGNIGAKYLFTEGGAKWRPFISAAYTMMHIKPFETKFTYQPLWGTTNREQTVQSDAVNIPNLLMLSGGVEYRFSKYGVAQAEAFYYKDVNKTHKTFDLFGLRAAILLNIK